MNPQHIKTYLRHFLVALGLLFGTSAFAIIKIESTTFDKATGKGTVEFRINGNAGPFDYQIISESGNTVINSTVPIPKDDTGTRTEGNLEQGKYFLRVITPLQCVFDYPFEIKDCDLKILPIATQSCGDDKGSATVDITYNGTDTPTYTWKNEQDEIVGTSKDINNLEPGKYCVTVKAGGCEVSECIEIKSSPALSLTTSSTAILNAFSPSSVTYNINGGVAPLSYVISGPDNYEVKGTTTQLPFTGTNDKLEVGEYRIVVTDANGCSISTIETVFGCEQIMDPNSFKLFPEITECPFSVEFDYKAKKVSNLGISIKKTNFLLEDRPHKNGTDVVKVMKDKACIELKVTDGLCDYESGTILAQACVEPTCGFSNKQTGDCGEGIGMLEVVTVKACDLGNPSNISYEWEHTDENSPIVATPNFPGGKTNVTVTDANGCTQIQTFVFDVAQTGRVVGGCGSDICVQFDLGDNPPYTFEWTNEKGVQTQIDNPTVCNLPEGNVAIKVKDGKGCVGVAHFDLPQGSKAIDATYDVKPEKTWHSSTDGEIHIQLSKGFGGSLDYNYRITNHFDYQRVGDNANNPNLDFLELTAGTYYLYVTDNTTGCVTVVAIEVYYCEKKTNENVLQVSPTYDAFGSDCGLNPLDINFSFDAQTNTITATFSGKNPFHYSFKKNGKSQKSGTVTDSKGDATFAASLGLYSFVISDGRPCTYTYNLNVIAGNTSTTGVNEEFWKTDAIIKNITGFCTGGSIKIKPFVAGFNKDLKYSWTGPDGFKADTKDIEGLTKEGTYKLKIEDEGCHTEEKDYKVEKEDVGEIKSEIKHICKTGEKGCIEFDLSDFESEGPFVFKYQGEHDPEPKNNGTSNRICDLEKGKYSVVISNNAGCTVSTSFEIKESTEIKLVSIAKSEPCRFYMNPGINKFGSITANVSGGQTPLTGIWYYGVDDSYDRGNQKSMVFNQSLFIEVSSPISLETPFVDYYKLEVKDANKCTFEITTTLDSRLEVSADVKGKCDNNQGGGTINLTTLSKSSDPSKPAVLKYKWADDPTPNTPTYSENRTNLALGVYKVVISDGECMIGQEYVIQKSNGPDVTNIAVGRESSAIASDATFGATVNGIAQPFTYECKGQNGNIIVKKGSVPNSGAKLLIEGLKQGLYLIEIKDNAGCIYSKVFEVERCSNNPNVDVVFGRSPLCSNITPNIMSAIANGGTSPYLYTWNDEAPNAANWTSIGEIGVYKLTVTDAIGCKAIKNIDFTAADKKTALTLSDCGLFPSTVKVNLDITGTANYKYQWSDGVTNYVNTRTDLPKGKYSVIVTSENGLVNCTYDFEIFDPSPKITEPCANSTAPYNASITFEDANDFKFVWAHNNSTSNSVSLNSAGVYPVRVTNTKTGCAATKKYTVDYFDENDIIITPVKCKSGTVKVSTKNLVLTKNAKLDGVVLPEFDYWSGQTAIELKSSNKTGVFELFDSQSGCTIKKTIDFGDYKAMELSFVKNQACKPNNGSITVSVKNPGASLVYSWNDGQTGKDKATISVNTDVPYTVKVTDAEGCSVTGSVKFTDADYTQAPTLTLTSFDVCSDKVNNGLIECVAKATIGGALSFAWDNGRTTANIASLATGKYTVVVTEVGNPCTATGSESVSKLSFSTLETCPTMMNGQIFANPFKGKDATYKWSNGAQGSSISGLAVGRYCVVMTDKRAGGCKNESCFDITEQMLLNCQSICNGKPFVNPGLNTLLTFVGFGDCTNGIGSVSFLFKANLQYALLENGNVLESGVMSGNKSFSLKEGRYELKVELNGNSECAFIYPFEINCCQSGKDPIDVTSFTVTPKPSATGAGSIFLNVNRPNVHYSWTGPGFSSVTQNIVNLTTEGEYCVVISGMCNEPVTKCFMITNLANCASTFSGFSVANGTACPDLNCLKGTLRLNPPSGVSATDLIIEWSNSSTNMSITDLRLGTYTVSVKNKLTGCSSSFTGTVSLPVGATVSPRNTDCSYTLTCGGCISKLSGSIIKTDNYVNCKFVNICDDGSEQTDNWTKINERNCTSVTDKDDVAKCKDANDNKYTCVYLYDCKKGNQVKKSQGLAYGKEAPPEVDANCNETKFCVLGGEKKLLSGPTYKGKYCYRAVLPTGDIFWYGYLHKVCNGVIKQIPEDDKIEKEFDRDDVIEEATKRKWFEDPINATLCPPFPSPIIQNSIQRSLTNEEDSPDSRKINSISVYPNPFHDLINIDVSLLQDEVLNIDLYDNLGRKVYDNYYDLIKGEHNIVIKADYLVSGVYIVQLKAKSGSVFKFRLINIK